MTDHLLAPRPAEVETDAPGPGAYDPKVAVSKFHDGVAVFGESAANHFAK